MQTEIDSANIV